MSPALITKYLDAAKQISQHAVLLPNGFRFSKHTTRRDWTDESLQKIRQFYDQFVDNSGKHLDWQRKDANSPRIGRIPLRTYIEATVVHRDALRSGAITIADVADKTKLSEKYLNQLWDVFSGDQDCGFVLDGIRRRWRSAAAATDIDAIVVQIETWQQMLWEFHSTGHLGRKGAPKRWMTHKNPLTSRQRLSLDLPTVNDGTDIVIHLRATNVAGDDAVVAWRSPMLQRPDAAPLLLRDMRRAKEQLDKTRTQLVSELPSYLQAASAVGAGVKSADVIADYQLNGPLFERCLAYLGMGGQPSVMVHGQFTEMIGEVGGYKFVAGWGSPATPSVVANASDDQVRIPGIAAAHSIVVHPSPELFAAVGWQSPIDGTIEIEAQIADAHPECGNGIEWFLQRRGGVLTNIDRGEFATGGKESIQPVQIDVAKGELVSVIVGPRNGDHSCDLTSVDFSIREIEGKQRVWSLAKEVSSRIQDGNPQSDSYDNAAVWHFYTGRVEDVGESADQLIPAGSLLAKWKAETDDGQRQALATKIQRLVQGAPPEGESADAVLYRQLGQIVGIESIGVLEAPVDQRFGRHPESHDVPDTDLFTRAPDAIEFRIPAEFAAKGVFLVDVECESDDQAIQVEVSLSKPDQISLLPDQPILINASEASRETFQDSLDQFRDLFPAALCYTKIVPVDEVVTLQLYVREDDHLKRLMCDQTQAAELDRLWDELLFIAQEPLAAEVVLEQLQQFATQDRPDLAIEFDELKTLYRERANAFRTRLIGLEPRHLESLIEFANLAWRRSLTSVEVDRLRADYANFRDAEISHDDAIRLLIARILVAPAFLYRLEQPADGVHPSDVSEHELATRLSYFLWSTMPDPKLRILADLGELSDGQAIVQQSRRMLDDPKVRRLAIHFACQWLHVRDFDQTVEKNERIFPEFSQLRAELYEEIVQFFTDMFRNDGSILDLVAADHTFVNQRLASHYGIEGVTGSDWQRIETVQSQGRGGVLGMAAVLASQSGASRTSPILRGNWVYETLLGQRLPRPPPGVPQLPDSVPGDKTARELIELHSGAPECATCHVKIDPYGFALEQFDTVGRLRLQKVDTKTELPDGQSIEGIAGLRNYLVEQRLDDVLRQFCKKLLGYALGREVQLSDEPLLEEMQTRLQSDGYRFSIAVESIVTSPQFRQIRGRLATTDAIE